MLDPDSIARQTSTHMTMIIRSAEGVDVVVVFESPINDDDDDSRRYSHDAVSFVGFLPSLLTLE